MSTSGCKTLPRLGLLGLGSRSTCFYLQQLNQAYRAVFGHDNTCPLLLLNADFNEFNKYLPDQFSNLEPALLAYLNTFSDLPVDQVMIPNITLHACYDRLHSKTAQHLKVIHPVELAIKRLQDEGLKEAVIFGSYHSMNSAVLSTQFNDAGIYLMKPEESDMTFIDNIRQRTYLDKETSQEYEDFNLLVKKYAQQSPVLIACTELSIVLKIDSLNIFDMVRMQVRNYLNQVF